MVKENKEELQKMVGKTIAQAYLEYFPDISDDKGNLNIEFTDGTKITIEAEYNEHYTGKSDGEYQKLINFYWNKKIGDNIE